MVDTLAIARTRHPGAKHSLDALCTRYGIDRSHRVKHGALLDAQLLAQLYVELTGGRQIGFSLRTDEMAATAISISFDSGASARSRAVRPPRPHAASMEELARHAAFVTGLVDPLWGVTGTAG
jgi:DNA polymerase-3 subunit epsilon